MRKKGQVKSGQIMALSVNHLQDIINTFDLSLYERTDRKGEGTYE